MSKVSIKNKLAQAIAPLQRSLVDKVVSIEGVPTNVLKVTTKKIGMSGDTRQIFDFSILNDVIIKFPVNEMLLIESLNDETQENTVDALNLWDILPVELVTYFSGDFEKDANNVKVGDIIIHVLYDENNNKIPLLFQVEKPMGRFTATKYLVKRKYEMSKYRGIPETEIQEKIDEYLENLD